MAPHNLTMVPAEAVPTLLMHERGGGGGGGLLLNPEGNLTSYKTSKSGTEYIGHIHVQTCLSLGWGGGGGGGGGGPLQLA